MDPDARPETIPRAGTRTLHVDAFHACSKTLLRARSILATHPPRTLELTSDPRQADVILYCEDGYLGVAHLREVARRVAAHPSALHAVFSESDWPYPVLPGAYPSLARRCGWADGWSFPIEPRMQAAAPSSISAPDYLFSFLGRASTHRIRQEILRLDAPGTPCLDSASAAGRIAGFHPERSYVDLLDRSRFVLCPRGIGASSIRIFEAMGRGRVPVIVGDGWQPPPGPAWATFTVRVPEHRVAAIPAMLSSLDGEAAAMGARAARAFRDHYAPDVFFDGLVAFLWRKYRDQPVALPPFAIRAVAAFSWRDARSLAHRLRHGAA